MSKKDYYEVLGVSKDATDEDIKKAYRKLAMQHHPDRNQGNHESETKFKELNEAYSILGDSQKRSQYDRFWSVGDNPFSWFSGGVDISDIFEGFFWWGFRDARRRPTQKRGEDLEYRIKIDLKTSIFWGKQTIEFDRFEYCGKCEWEGWSGKAQCRKCHGSGYVKYRQESFFGTIESSTVCEECNWTWESFSHVCVSCDGKKRLKKTVKIDVAIPAWIDDGMIIKMTGEGNAGIWTQARGDLYIKFEVELEEKNLKRDGDDLHLELEVDILEAILWNEKEINVPILWKRKIVVPQWTQFWSTLKYTWDGVKDIQSDRKGDLYIEITFDVPKKLSKKEKTLLLQIAEERKIDIKWWDSLLWKIFW